MVEYHSVMYDPDKGWWHCQFFDLINAAPGGSGATEQLMTANYLSGYNLDADTEYLYFTGHICSDWDGVSNPEIMLKYETDQDNTGGADADVANFSILCYYKGDGDTANKTQTVTSTQTIGKAARYKHFTTTFMMDYGLASHVIDANDCISFRLSFVVTNSDVTDVVAHHAMFRYKTKKVHIPVT